MKRWLLGQLHTLHAKRATTAVMHRYPDVAAHPSTRTIQENAFHLSLAVTWLVRAEDASGSAGVSNVYDLLHASWGPAYRETTGYIIPTFLAYAKLTGKHEFAERAKRMGNWEIEVQDESGGIGEPRPDGTLGLKIFNTGQVILGWCALFDETSEKKYLDAAVRAADWLVANQEKNGSWNNFSNNGPKTFDTRVAWALYEVYMRAQNQKYKTASQKNIEWAVTQQTENGWFENTSLAEKNKPWTHLIAYTISGILEYAFLTNDEKLFAAAQKPAEALAQYYMALEDGKYLPCTFDENWQSTDAYSCLTGNAQMAIIWVQLHQKTNDELFLRAANKMVTQMKQVQIISTTNSDINGGVTGSYPIEGSYVKYGIPNWGVKFFADMLIQKQYGRQPLLG
jgi:hypothetical protein